MPFTEVPADASAQLRLVVECLLGVSKFDVTKVASTLSDELVYEMVCPSLDKGPLDKKFLLTILGVLSKTVADMTMLFEDNIEVPGKVWLFVSTTSKLLATEGRYDNKYVFMFDIITEEDGSLKIKRLREMLDTKVAFQVQNVASHFSEDA